MLYSVYPDPCDMITSVIVNVDTIEEALFAVKKRFILSNLILLLCLDSIPTVSDQPCSFIRWFRFSREAKI